jgi:8-oxo-dGTP pyrophosphatase MutT (NUDIX family)
MPVKPAVQPPPQKATEAKLLIGRKPDGATRVRFVIPYGNGYLLQGTRSPKYAGKVRAPGGKVEAGETLLQAAIREYKEEFSVALDEDDLMYVGKDPAPDNGEYHFFLIKRPTLEPRTYTTNDVPPETVDLVETVPDETNYVGYDFRNLLEM